MTLLSIPGVTAIPASAVAPLAGSVMWNLPTFKGYSRTTASSITMNTISTNVTTAEVPFALFASAENVTCSGSRSLGALAINPYQHLQHTWTLTYNDDSPVESNDEITDPNTLLAVNMYTDQIGGEAVFMIHNPGTYKLTLASESANGTTNSTTATITASAPTYSHTFISDGSGNDANDGKDPWGLSLTAGDYTESTGVLTETNAFTSYVHDSENYLTDSSNWLWLSFNSAGTTGWYRVASKTDNSTVVLLDKLGADWTDVTSSDGPKQNFTNSNLVSNTMVHLESGDSHSVTSNFTIEGKSGIYVSVYGGSTQVTITAASGVSGELFSLNAGSNDDASTIVYLGKTVWDANAIASKGIGGGHGGTGRTTHHRYTFDRTKNINGTSTNGISVQYLNNTVTFNLCFWKHYFVNRRLAAEEKKQGLFYDLDGSLTRTAVVGGTFESSCDSATFDHHCYPNGDHNNRLYAYNTAAYDDNVGYFFNTNLTADVDYVTFTRNKFNFSDEGIDLSNGTNDPTASNFTNVIISMNSFTGHFGGSIFTFCAGGVYVGHNVFFSAAAGGNPAVNINGEQTGYYILDNNIFYDVRSADSPQNPVTTDRDSEIVDNYIEYSGSSTYTLMNYDSADLSTNSYYENNQFYAPSVSGDYINDADAAGLETLSEFNTAVSATTDNTHSDPGFPDPTASGGFHDFRI